MSDIRFALRQLLKNPGFTIVAVLSLAFGIGASAVMFGLIDGVLLSKPYERAERLVLISPARTDGQPFTQGSTIGQWMAWRSRSKALEELALYVWTFNYLVLPDGSESMEGMYVTKNYFKTLGLRLALGREFDEGEMAHPGGRATSVIIGHELWQRRFNGDPNVVGKTLRISRNPDPLTIVGVMAPGVRFLPDPSNASEPNYSPDARVDFWLGVVPDETKPKDNGWNAVGLLRDGATLAQAQTELSSIAATQAGEDPDLKGITAVARPIQDELNREGRRLLLPLAGAVVLVFLIACGNISGLLLARGLMRRSEYALRSALGAGRRRLVRQVLTESLTVALLGAVLGAMLAVGTVQLLKLVESRSIPRLDAVNVGWRVFGAGVVLALVAGVLAGLVPAWRAAGIAPYQSLKGARTGANRQERRLLGGMAVLQIALTMALLVGAALMIRTAHNLAKVSPGYQTENLLVMSVTGMQSDRWRQFHTLALERVQALPGVKQAAFVWGLPLTGNKWNGTMEVVGRPILDPRQDYLELPLRSVTPDYFDALGIHLMNGRGFRSSDDEKAARVAVVNEALVARYFPGAGAGAVGQQLRFKGDTNRTIEIVGIVGNTRTEELSRPAEPEIYFPFWQNGAFSKSFVIRTVADPRAMANVVRREILAVDPSAAVEHIQTMEDIHRGSLASRTFALHLLVAFSLVASVLALVGIYGLVSLSVGSRTKEIAVRVAIGAQRHRILGLILGDSLRLIVVGLAVGTVVAIVLGQLLSSLLFQVSPADPVTLVIVTLLFAGAALLASWLPAWRAVKRDPMKALRDE
ncbi:MAG TPA: ABC transporter permease [Candidatus Limnocylindria bacterium]|jgi:putative ABC transport system permease protein|nr:ABC transporter permease [Candidatus Limnocylindria bacterium]